MKTTVVGSYPVPVWLQALPTPDSLVDAVTVAIKAQELAGIDLISDGEIGRWDLERNAPGGMVERFVRPMAGVSCELTKRQLDAFYAKSNTKYRKAPPGVVTGPVGSGTLNLRAEWDRVRALTTAPLKFTLTSPYMMAKVVIDDHYNDLEALAMAFAATLAEQVVGIDAQAIQIDEPTLPGFPHESEIAARATNLVLDALESAGKAVHLCFGNYGGQMIQHGEYDKLITYFNMLRCDHLVLETTRRPKSELGWLREVEKPKRFGFGVIDVKDLQIESPAQVASRLEELAGLFGAERIAYANPDCGLQHLPRGSANGKLRSLVAGRDLFAGKSA